MYMYMWYCINSTVYGCTAIEHTVRSEDKPVKLSPAFRLFVGSGDQTQVHQTFIASTFMC